MWQAYSIAYGHWILLFRALSCNMVLLYSRPLSERKVLIPWPVLFLREILNAFTCCNTEAADLSGNIATLVQYEYWSTMTEANLKPPWALVDLPSRMSALTTCPGSVALRSATMACGQSQTYLGVQQRETAVIILGMRVNWSRDSRRGIHS